VLSVNKGVFTMAAKTKKAKKVVKKKAAKKSK
jgi:hypothetical protein